jgi:hypothetical protein
MIRVFSIPKGNRLYSLRRPIIPADVFSIAFNPISTLIGVTGNPGSMYIYKIVNSTSMGNSSPRRYRGLG